MKTKKQIIKNRDIKSNLSAIINLILLLIFIVAIPVYIWVFHRDFIRDIDSIEEVVALLDANKTAAILIYLGMQIMQIIVNKGNTIDTTAFVLSDNHPQALFLQSL